MNKEVKEELRFKLKLMIIEYAKHFGPTKTEKHYIDLLRSEYDDLSFLMSENYTGNGKLHQNTLKKVDGYLKTKPFETQYIQ